MSTSKNKSELHAVVTMGIPALAEIDIHDCQGLIPLCGCASLIDYTLESLLLTDVTAVIIACSTEAAQIRHHVSNCWCSDTLPFKITVQVCEGAQNLGDMMRCLDNRRCIHGDFILCSAGTITNCDLKQAVAEHKKRRQKDTAPIMTLVYRRCSPNFRTRSRQNDVIVMINKDTQRILHYQPLDNVYQVQLPQELCEYDEDNDIHLDLLDTNIAICSNQIPPLFSDNFDDQSKHDLVKEVLVNEEILGNQIHAHIIDDSSYAASVTDFRSYIAVSQDLICRYAYPVTPDRVAFKRGTSLRYYKKNLYYDKALLDASRDLHLKHDVIISGPCKLDSNVTISNTVIGSNCQIAAGVTIISSIIWDNVCIGSNCSISNAVICNNVSIGSGASICSRTVLLEGANIDANTTISSGSIIRASKDTTGSPASRRGHQTISEGSSAPEDDDDDDAEPWPEWHPLSLATQAEGDEQEDDDDDDDEDEGNVEVNELKGDVSGEGEDTETDEDLKVFYQEVVESVKRCFDENINWEHVVLEINGSKHAYNISIRDLQRLVMRAILDYGCCGKAPDASKATDVWKSIKQVFVNLKDMLLKYSGSKRDAELVYLKSIQDYSVSHDVLLPCLTKLLHYLYDADVLSEEAILEWNDDLASKAPTVSQKIVQFIEWLKAAEEESDD